MFARPNLMPNFSSDRRYWSGSTSTAPRRRPRRGCTAFDRMLPHESKRSRDGAFHFAAIDDEVEHPVLEEKLTALKSLGQLLANRLLDDARAGEANQRSRLRDVQIAEHREARRHASRGRVGQDRDVRKVLLIEPRQRRADFRHLHQRQRAFHHAGAAGARDDNHRTACRERALDASRDLLADDHAHAAADEAVLHRRHDGFVPVDAPACDDDRVVHAGRRDARLQARMVRLRIGELQRIRRDEPAVVFDPRAVEQRAQPIEGAHAEVKAALRADAQILREILVVEDLRAPCALDPQALGHPAWLCVGGVDPLARLFEPGHMWRLYLNPVRGT